MCGLRYRAGVAAFGCAGDSPEKFKGLYFMRAVPPPLEEKARPIFIVSSGRSGSTILTWCLGQHPNIIPQEESNWLGPFAIDAAVGHQRGTQRGERGQLSANFITREELLESFG